MSDTLSSNNTLYIVCGFRIYTKLVLLRSDVVLDETNAKCLKLNGPDSLNMRELRVKLPTETKTWTYTSVRGWSLRGSAKIIFYRLGKLISDILSRMRWL